MACDKGHVLIRMYDPATKTWRLQCVHCPYSIPE